MIPNVVRIESFWKTPTIDAINAAAAILIEPPKADAAPTLPENGANEAAVVLGLINPIKKRMVKIPPTANV